MATTRSFPSLSRLLRNGVQISKRRKGSGLQNRPAIRMIKASPSAFLHRPLPPPTLLLPLDPRFSLSLFESSSLPLHPAVAEEARSRISRALSREKRARAPHFRHRDYENRTRDRVLTNFSIIVLVSYLVSYSLSVSLLFITRISLYAILGE